MKYLYSVFFLVCLFGILALVWIMCAAIQGCAYGVVDPMTVPTVDAGKDSGVDAGSGTSNNQGSESWSPGYTPSLVNTGRWQ